MTGEPDGRVLVLDANRQVRTALVALLRLLGMRVVEAADLDGARQAIRDLRPPVAVVDWCLPDRARSGAAAVQELLKADSGLRVIVYTARHDPAVEPVARASGVVAYLPKGTLGKGDLVAAIQAAGGAREGQEEP